MLFELDLSAKREPAFVRCQAGRSGELRAAAGALELAGSARKDVLAGKGDIAMRIRSAADAAMRCIKFVSIRRREFIRARQLGRRFGEVNGLAAGNRALAQLRKSANASKRR